MQPTSRARPSGGMFMLRTTDIKKTYWRETLLFGLLRFFLRGMIFVSIILPDIKSYVAWRVIKVRFIRQVCVRVVEQSAKFGWDVGTIIVELLGFVVAEILVVDCATIKGDDERD